MDFESFLLRCEVFLWLAFKKSIFRKDLLNNRGGFVSA
jgi:hypothetical protein